MGKPRCRHAPEISDVKQAQRGRGALGVGLGFRHNSMVFRHSAPPERGKKNSPLKIFVERTALLTK